MTNEEKTERAKTLGAKHKIKTTTGKVAYLRELTVKELKMMYGIATKEGGWDAQVFALRTMMVEGSDLSILDDATSLNSAVKTIEPLIAATEGELESF